MTTILKHADVIFLFVLNKFSRLYLRIAASAKFNCALEMSTNTVDFCYVLRSVLLHKSECSKLCTFLRPSRKKAKTEPEKLKQKHLDVSSPKRFV